MGLSQGWNEFKGWVLFSWSQSHAVAPRYCGSTQASETLDAYGQFMNEESGFQSVDSNICLISRGGTPRPARNIPEI